MLRDMAVPGLDREERQMSRKRQIEEPKRRESSECFRPGRAWPVGSARECAGSTVEQQRERDSKFIPSRRTQLDKLQEGQEAINQLGLQRKIRVAGPPEGVVPNTELTTTKRKFPYHAPPNASTLDNSLCPPDESHSQAPAGDYVSRHMQESGSESTWRPGKHLIAQTNASEEMKEVLSASSTSVSDAASSRKREMTQSSELAHEATLTVSQRNRSEAEHNKAAVSSSIMFDMLRHPHPVEGRNVELNASG